MIPRPEYPRPQLRRDEWLNLNGQWQFEIDQGDSGLERGLVDHELSGTIIVPFCPESDLSGVGNRDFLQAVWYRREVVLPEQWRGRRVVAHFGAVDHDATVWVEGKEVGRHRGGFSPFSVVVSERAEPGSPLTLVLRARDLKEAEQARGKQSTEYHWSGCTYPRTTGIWQTVWLEPLPDVAVEDLRIAPVVARGAFAVEVGVSHRAHGHQVRVAVSDSEGECVSALVSAELDMTALVDLPLPEDRVRLWEPGDPYLYDVRVEVLDAAGCVVDRVRSYAGLRSVSIDGHRVLINGRAVFQRLVLDQGYWPESLMTAPSDEALVEDIRTGLSAGFNGARAHQKVFEDRYYYHADRLGYLVWGEFGDWGVNHHGPDGWTQNPPASFVTEWVEALSHLRNHPSIIGWCPMNESMEHTHDRITVLDDVTRAMFLATKAIDPTRPVLDASGFSHRVLETDVYDSHSYEQDPDRFRLEQAGLAQGQPFINEDEGHAISTPYRGQPYFVSEFGGIWWSPEERSASGADEGESWGYGDRVQDEEDLYRRFEGLTGVLLDDPRMFGYCYTQLSDVFQEKNGVVRFDRTAKLDLDRLRRAQERVAAIERPGVEDGQGGASS